MVVEAWLVRAAATRPQRVAVQTSEGERTYAELLRSSGAAAAWMAERGVGPGDRVALALTPGLAFAEALHACLLLGALAVPIDPRLSASERTMLCTETLLTVDRLAWEGAQGPTGAHPPTLGAAGHDLDAAAMVVHTSGTTSTPRPVVLTYGNLLWSALGSAVALGLDPDERWLCAMPLAHVGGLSVLVRSAIYATTAVVHERFDTDRVLHSLLSEDITMMSVVATTLRRLLDAGLSRPPALRCSLAGGGPVPAALLARARDAGVPVCQTYGLTESCSQATTTPVAVVGDATPSAGPPLFCTHAMIAVDGEILLRGPTVAPAAVAQDGWLHTGDLGHLDELGRLHVTGRAADTIISGGENVAPAEVEAVLEAHPDVAEAAVVASTDPEWGEAVTAIVVARADARPESETLRVHCAERLAAFKVPRHILHRTEPLPRTRSGKLLRRELT